MYSEINFQGPCLQFNEEAVSLCSLACSLACSFEVTSQTLHCNPVFRLILNTH